MSIDDNFKFVIVENGFQGVIKVLKPLELFNSYNGFQHWVNKVSISQDHIKYFIKSRLSEHIVGMFVLKKSEKKLCSVYIKEEFRGMGLFSHILDLSLFILGDGVTVEASEGSVIESKLIEFGFNNISLFDVVNGSGDYRKEITWKT